MYLQNLLTTFHIKHHQSAAISMSQFRPSCRCDDRRYPPMVSGSAETPCTGPPKSSPLSPCIPSGCVWQWSPRQGVRAIQVYFRVKFSPGRFAISRRIVPRTIHSPRRNPAARVGIPELSSEARERFVDRRVFDGIFGNSIWMPARRRHRFHRVPR